MVETKNTECTEEDRAPHHCTPGPEHVPNEDQWELSESVAAAMLERWRRRSSGTCVAWNEWSSHGLLESRLKLSHLLHFVLNACYWMRIFPGLTDPGAAREDIVLLSSVAGLLAMADCRQEWLMMASMEGGPKAVGFSEARGTCHFFSFVWSLNHQNFPPHLHPE
jgi:hypothetical protein